METSPLSGLPKELQAAPGLPIEVGFENLYVMQYIEYQPHIVQKNFRYSGPFNDAIKFAQDYCKRMRYRFIIVSPFLSDLSAEIKKFNG